MLTTGTQNPPEPLARVQAAYHGTARPVPASADRLAWRVERNERAKASERTAPSPEGHVRAWV